MDNTEMGSEDILNNEENNEKVKGGEPESEDMLIRVTLYPDKARKDAKPLSELDEIIVERKPLTVSLSKMLNRDLLPFFILSLLNDRPHFGIEIMAAIKKHGSLWSSSPGTIYPLLNKLETEGLIVGRWEPGLKRDRHVYELTEQGRYHLDSIKEKSTAEIEAAIGTMADFMETVKQLLSANQ